MVADLLVTALQILFYAVFAWVILSWIPTTSDHPVGRLSRGLDRLILPLISPIRRVIPPLRLGGGLLDLSPIVLLIAIQIVVGIVR